MSLDLALFSRRPVRLGSDLPHQDGHRPTSDGPQAHALLAPGSFAPGDVLTRPDYYTGFYKLLGAVWPRIRRSQGHPDTPIPIYRAVPRKFTSFHAGDWVTISPVYANTHRSGEVGWHTLVATVPAHTLRWAGDDLMEWGYFGPTVVGKAL